MRSLVIDTSNRYLVIAMYENDQLLEAISEVGSQRQSENAIPYIEKLLNQLGLELFDFDELIVTCGPGSYTGVRVGLTIVKTLKTVRPSFKVKMISSKKVFVGIYQQGKEVVPEQMMDISAFETLLCQYPDYEVVGQGDIVGIETKESCIYQNMYDLAKKIEAVTSVHALLPKYIKDVEAKKIWQPQEK